MCEIDLHHIREFLEDLRAASELLSPNTVRAIEEGLSDIQAGRTISLDELEQKYGLKQ